MHLLLTKRLCTFFSLQKSEITMEVGGWVKVSLGICLRTKKRKKREPVIFITTRGRN